MACWCSAARAGVLARRSARQAPADRRTTTTTRSIAYRYDGLNRLTGADESGSTSNSYDLANRTSVTVNGTTTTYTYNAANQVTNAGYSYDAAGNLLSDGTTSHVYDALNRVTSSGGVSATYNGDGVLAQRGATHYTQDLAAALSQVLNDGSANYVYGMDRLLTDDGSAQTWYLGDALGSVRMTLNDTLGHIHVTFEGKALCDFREKQFANSLRVNQILHRVDSLICTPKK